MQSRGNGATAAQKRWYSEIAGLGCVLTGSQAEIDHLAGASARYNGVDIGNWFVIALCPSLHRNGQVNRTQWRFRLADEFGGNLARRYGGFSFEKMLFQMQCFRYMNDTKKQLPFGYDVMQSIIGYRK